MSILRHFLTSKTKTVVPSAKQEHAPAGIFPQSIRAIPGRGIDLEEGGTLGALPFHRVNMRRRIAKGFTLVEVMIVVGIISILAAIAIPAFTRYARKSRTAEAVGHLNKMWAGSVTYYMSDFTDKDEEGNPVAIAKQFPGPSGEWETKDKGDNVYCCTLTGAKCPGGSKVWATDPVWTALKFALADPHNYLPGYFSSGTSKDSVFTAVALGDLDCDGVIAKFRRDGSITSTGDVSGQTQAIVENELE